MPGSSIATDVAVHAVWLRFDHAAIECVVLVHAVAVDMFYRYTPPVADGGRA